MRGSTYPEDKAVDAVVARLTAMPEYRRLFAEAFGRPGGHGRDLGSALAAFQRSLTANNSPFDRYMRGDDDAMTRVAAARHAPVRAHRLRATVTTARCSRTYKLHVLGVPDNPELPVSDAGAENRYAFRTASLQESRLHRPYMHNGRL